MGAGRVLTGIVGCGDGDELFPKEAALFKKARLLSVRSCWSEARASLATLIDGKMLSLSRVYEEHLATDVHRSPFGAVIRVDLWSSVASIGLRQSLAGFLIAVNLFMLSQVFV